MRLLYHAVPWVGTLFRHSEKATGEPVALAGRRDTVLGVDAHDAGHTQGRDARHAQGRDAWNAQR